ncbi:MAG: N-acetylmuramoyl-L-alanine amidase [Alphaproteobacteria bacterium]|nr:N-acetylmuramoyl-L-alanine amidase [Alphaproteobacteria bacterium]
MLCIFKLSPSLLLSLVVVMGSSEEFCCFPGLEGRVVEPVPIYNLQGYRVVPAENFPGGSFNFALNHWNDRPEGDLGNVRSLVLHYTVCPLSEALRLFANATEEASAHYVVTETEEGSGVKGGKVIQVVPEEKRAWHAGPSEWRDVVCDTQKGRARGLNSASIGIENVNKGFTEENGVRTWYPFEIKQMEALGELCSGIVARWGIQPTNVVGHSDILIGEKSDPGILFPWGELYHKHGVGAWLTSEELAGHFSEGAVKREPLPQGVSEAYFLYKLREYGYAGVPDGAGEITPELSPFLGSFRMHFSANQQPCKLAGPLRKEDMAWIHGLTTKYPVGL